MAIKEEENNFTEKFANKRNILNREDLEYSAQKLFTYTALGLAAIGIYTALAYLVIKQLKKD